MAGRGHGSEQGGNSADETHKGAQGPLMARSPGALSWRALLARSRGALSWRALVARSRGARVQWMRTRSGDAAPLLEVEEDGRSEDGQCKHHRPGISTSSWMRTAGLAVGAVLLILALRAAHEEARCASGPNPVPRVASESCRRCNRPPRLRSSSDGPTAAGHRTRYAVCRFGRSFVEFLSAALKMSVRSPRTRFDTSSLLHNRLVGR